MNKRKSQIFIGLILGMVSVSLPLGAATKLGEKDCNCNKPAQVEAGLKSTNKASKAVEVTAPKTSVKKAL